MIPEQEKEQQLLAEFRAVVHDFAIDDVELRCFLRARNHDVREAEKMLREASAWRKENDFDSAWTWEIPEPLREPFQFYTDGHTKDGKVVIFLPIGLWETRKKLQEGWHDEMEKLMCHFLSSVYRTVKNSGPGEFIGVVDLAGLTYWKIAHIKTVQMVLKTIRLFELNFPEKLTKGIVINAPWVLNCIFPLIQPIVSGRTMGKVQIFDSDHTKYLPIIQDLIPEKSMPSCLMDALRKNIK